MRTAKLFQSAILSVPTIFLVLTFAAQAQSSYVFTKVMDVTTQRPDGAGLFVINSVTTPAFDGQWVVFRDSGSKDDNSLQAIWSFNTKDATFHKLVDLSTVMPGGTATFTELHLLDTAPAVRNGIVVFLARSTSTAPPAREGLYTVPVAGGAVIAVTPVADYRTADPSGGTFTLFDSAGLQIGGFGFDGTTVAFHGQGSNQSVGIYSASATGTALSLIADSLHPFAATGVSVNNFTAPVVSGTNVAMAGTDGSLYSGLYLGKAGGNGVVTELVNSKQQLPGGTNAGFRTRFDAPYLALDGTLLAFHASDATAPAASPFSGLYSTDLTSHTISKIADVNSTLTGLGKLRNIGDQGVSVSQGNVLFRAADTTGGYPGNNGLYVWANGTAARVVGTGDLIGGKAVQVVHDPGPSALSGGGFAFLVEFGASNAFAIYYATPAAGAGTVASFNAASSASNGILAAGTIASAFGQGLADSAVPAGAPPLTTTLGNIALNVKDSAGTTRAAPLYFAGPTQINYVVPDGTAIGAAPVTVTKNGQTVATGTVQVAAVAPGLFTANADGKGVAAAIALKAAASGAQTIQFAAACDAAGRNCVTAPLDMGVATDQVFLELFGTGIRGYKTAITATIGGVSAAPAFAVQSQYPGMDQVNLLIDRSLIGRGDVDVILTVDGVAANTVRINVK